MDHSGMVRYYRPAAIKLFLHDSRTTAEAMLALDKALGVSLYYDYYEGRTASLDDPLTKEMEQLLSALMGPYSETVLKAYQIKHGIEP